MPLFNVLFRRDSTANWEAANPILLDGEVGYERTADGLLLMKMGDGVMDASGVVSGTHWKDLPYCSGPVGPSPEHEWSGTELKFKNPDGSWGTSVDLKGAKGDTGKTGPQGVPGKDGQDGKDGAPGTAQPATASTLGGVMVSTGLTADAAGHLSVSLPWSKTACYNSAIVVTHNSKLYFWLKASGVGTADGVREPGTSTASAHWAEVPLLSAVTKAQSTADSAMAASGVTAAAYGPTADAKPAHSGTFKVPAFTVDARGRVVSAATRTITLPAAPTTPTVTNISGNAATATKLQTARTFTIPAKMTVPGSPDNATLSFNGSGNVTFACSCSGNCQTNCSGGCDGGCQGN